MNIKLSTRARLILMASIPTIALLYFSVYVTFDKARVASNMSKLESLVDLSIKIGALSHELQKERGMSAGFIGSKGSKFATELPAQRSDTNKKADDLHSTLKDFDLSHYAGNLQTALKNAQESLEKLDSIRNGISSLKTEASESAAYYTKTIGLYLSVPSLVSTLSTQSEISQLASAYSSLLEAKERAGRERALLSGVFASDKFTADSLNKFLMNFSAQDTYNSVFFNFALDSQKEFYKNKISGEAVNEVSRMKKIAIENSGEPKLGIDATYWFKMSTDRINLLKDVENKLSADLLGKATNLRSEARNMMILFIALSLISIIATFIIAFYLIRDMLRQLGGEPDYAAEAVHKISGGDLTATLEVQAGDTSSLLYSLKVMQDSLRTIVNEIRNIVEAAAVRGDFSIKMNMNGKAGYTKELSELLNSLSNVSETGLNDVTRVATALANGDLSQKITNDYPGVFGQTKNGVNSTVEALNKIVAEIQQVVEAAAKRGDFSVKMDMNGKLGYAKTLSELLN